MQYPGFFHTWGGPRVISFYFTLLIWIHCWFDFLHTKTFDKKEDTISFDDLSKPFNCVSHEIFLCQLQTYYFHHTFYLVGRTQALTIEGSAKSDNYWDPTRIWTKAILFIIYINLNSLLITCSTISQRLKLTWMTLRDHWRTLYIFFH